MNIPDFHFPFPPYDIQLDFMKNLYSVLERGLIGIFESPTGTGKSLSLICGVLRFIEDESVRSVNELQRSIENINIELVASVGKSDDWIDEQYQLLRKRKELAEVEEKLKKIQDYDQKIQNIRHKIKEKERRIVLKEPSKILDDTAQDDDETDDFLLAEEDDDEEDEEPIEDETEAFAPLQIFFCSRTHSQLSQLVGEVKSTLYSKSIRSVSLASRQIYCINKSVKQLRNSSQINERCLELQKSQSKSTQRDDDKNSIKSKRISNKSCPFYKKNLEKLRNLSITKVMDIEELVKVATEEKSCPYYSSRAAVSDSQLIFVPYQILLSKATREQCGIKLKGNIVIIDEAHNLMDTISQIHTSTITLEHLRVCYKQLMNYKLRYSKRFGARNLLKFNQLIFITKQLKEFLEISGNTFKALEAHEVLSETAIYSVDLIDILKFCDQTKLAPKVFGYSKIHDKLQADDKAKEDAKKNATKDLLRKLQDKSKKSIIVETQENLVVVEPQPNVIRILLQFLECLLQRYNGGRILVNVDNITKEPSMKFLLLDPSSPFEDLVKDCRSIVLAGGTMKPTEELTEQLFKHCQDRVEIYSFGHVVPKHSILPIALSHGCSGKEFLFTHANKSSEMVHEAAITIANICKIVPGGVVCFFTSYENMNCFNDHLNKSKVIDAIKLKKNVFVEPRVSSKVDKVLEDFSRCAKQKSSSLNGAIIFSVIGGKLSEGMNFSDDLGRCVIIVGLPFPNKTNPELVEKMKFISKHSNSSASSQYYENLCMKAVNQSIGRAIRHIGDYATVLLLDSRYHRQNILQKLPNWIKENLLIANSYGKVHSEVAKFFKEKSKIE